MAVNEGMEQLQRILSQQPNETTWIELIECLGQLARLCFFVGGCGVRTATINKLAILSPNSPK
jgi:hypothetical protein